MDLLKMKIFNHSPHYHVFKFISYACYKMPPTIRYNLASLGGEAYYWLARDHSRKADENMRRVLGEKTINRKVRMYSRRSFRNYVKYMTELITNPYMSHTQIQESIASGRWSSLEDTTANGRGVMVVTMHFGNWDIAGSLVTTNGYKVSSVAKDFQPEDLNELIQGARRERGLTIYSVDDRKALRGLYQALDNREIVALIIDAPLQNDGVVVNFFGAPARFAAGPAAIALKKNVPVLVAYVARQPGNTHYYAFWSEPIDFKPSGDRDRDIQGLTQKIADEIERIVRRHPDQWYMFRHLWLNDEEVKDFRDKQAEAAAKVTLKRRNISQDKVLTTIPAPVPETTEELTA